MKNKLFVDVLLFRVLISARLHDTWRNDTCGSEGVNLIHSLMVIGCNIMKLHRDWLQYYVLDGDGV